MWLLHKPGVTYIYIEGEKHEEAYYIGTLIINTNYIASLFSMLWH